MAKGFVSFPGQSGGTRRSGDGVGSRRMPAGGGQVTNGEAQPSGKRSANPPGRGDLAPDKGKSPTPPGVAGIMKKAGVDIPSSWTRE